MNRFTTPFIDKEEVCKRNREKKPMIVKLNSEQLDDFNKKFPDTGELFCLTYRINDDKTVTFNSNSDGRLLEVLNLVKWLALSSIQEKCWIFFDPKYRKVNEISWLSKLSDVGINWKNPLLLQLW